MISASETAQIQASQRCVLLWVCVCVCLGYAIASTLAARDWIKIGLVLSFKNYTHTRDLKKKLTGK